VATLTDADRDLLPAAASGYADRDLLPAAASGYADTDLQSKFTD